MRDFIFDDCMNGMSKFSDGFFNLAIVDPPYMLSSNDNRALMKLGNAKKRNYKFFNDEKPGSEYFNELFRVSKHQIIWGGNYFTSNLRETNAWIIWDKNNGESLGSDGEMAWTSLNFLLKIWKIHWTGSASLWEDTQGKIHATQKPVKLYLRCLMEFAKQGDLILDTHAGSGSSIIACEKLGFDYVAFENDPEIYAAASRRISILRSEPELNFSKESDKSQNQMEMEI